MTWLWSWQVYFKIMRREMELAVNIIYLRDTNDALSCKSIVGLHGFTTSCHTETVEHEDRYDHWDRIMRSRIKLGDYKWVCAIIGDHTDELAWCATEIINVWRSLSQAYWLMRIRSRLGINRNGCIEFAVLIWVIDLNLTSVTADHSTKIGFCYQYW